jgi:alkanesulfonate monooxygenase SsuD/methylene tetrahydromethanopterin reductase-like flavin-dependent oxidoreductase (luciferase family)
MEEPPAPEDAADPAPIASLHDRQVRLGVYVDGRNPGAWRVPWADHCARTLELVADAERRGVPSVWLSEHHGFEDGYLSQPLVLAAAIAARTTTIRIGTAVLLLPLRHPRHVAEQAALIDVLSRGRLELGVGSGYLRDEFAAFAAERSERFAALESGVRQLRELWADPATLPPPVQRPVPIWLGHNTAAGARRAGRLGTGLLSLDLSLARTYVEAFQAAGHPERPRMGGVVQVLLASDPERSWAAVRPHLAAQWNVYRAHEALSDRRPPPPPIDPERWRHGQDGRPPRFSVLTPDELLDRLARYRDTPVTDVLLWGSICGMPEELVEEQLGSMAALAPRLAEWG